MFCIAFYFFLKFDIVFLESFSSMISYLCGKIILEKEEFVVIEVRGVGYKVFISPETLRRIEKKERVEFFTYQHVRENSLTLYGFLTYEELEFFETIISVSGLGPKVGLAVLSLAPIERIKKAIAQHDVNFLTRVSGLGFKKAELIILELKNKIGMRLPRVVSTDQKDVLEALAKLGYKKYEVEEMLSQIPENLKTLEEKVKWVLKNLGK